MFCWLFIWWNYIVKFLSSPSNHLVTNVKRLFQENGDVLQSSNPEEMKLIIANPALITSTIG